MKYLRSLLLFSLPLCAECEKELAIQTLNVHHTEGPGIGYKKGYSTLQLFIAAPREMKSVVPFLDLRGHIFNDGKPAVNVGTGIRGFSSGANMIFGGNVYFDYRKTGHLNCKQIGIGVEALGRVWEARANGYIGFGRTKSHDYSMNFQGFVGHNILFTQKFQYSLSGVDAEAGAYVTKAKYFNLFAGAGPYYFSPRAGSQAIGGKIRLTAAISKYFTIEGRLTYDPHFHFRGQGVATLYIPFGRSYEVVKERPSIFSARIRQPVVRQEIIPVDHHRTSSKAIDPLTNQPYYFVFVNNTSSSNGTFESPYPTLSQAQQASAPHNIIYVFSGDGTSRNLNTGIQLQGFQKLWGSGTDHTLITTDGPLLIPALTSDMPLLTSPSNVVTLANQNEVSGFRINTLASFFAIGAASSVNGANIANNQISLASGATGISLASFAGTGTFEANNITGSNISETGISVQGSGSSTLDLTLQNNNIQNSGTSGNGIAISATSGSPVISADIQNNTVAQGNFGISISNAAMNPTFNVSMFANTLSNFSEGINVIASENAIYQIEAQNNVVSNTSANGISITIDTGSPNVTAFVNENTISSASNGILFLSFSLGTPTFSATANNNFVQDYTPSGIRFVDVNGNNEFFCFGNTLVGLGSISQGITVENGTGASVGGQTLKAQINNNTLLFNEIGVFMSDSARGILCAQVLNNDSDDPGYFLEQTDSAFFTLEEPSRDANIGSFDTDGIVDDVPAGTCGFP